MTETFFESNNRGRYGEHIVMQQSRGIDFGNLKPVTPIGDRPCYDSQSWEAVSGNNKNRDWIVTNADGTRQHHEVKTDYAALVDKGNSPLARHTGNIFIEVDKNNISNIPEISKKYLRGTDNATAWFNCNAGGHADFYHFYFPLINRDGGGNECPDTDMTIAALSPEEINTFLIDDTVGEHDSIITHMPLEFSLCVRWDKVQECLERIAGVKFNTNPPSKYGRALIVLPLREIVKELKPSRGSSYDGRMTIIPICRTVSKGKEFPDREGKLWMPHRLFEGLLYREIVDSNGEQLLESLGLNNLPMAQQELLKRIIGREKVVQIIIEGQIENIPAYTYREGSGWKEFQYFNSIEATRHLPRYR